MTTKEFQPPMGSKQAMNKRGSIGLNVGAQKLKFLRAYVKKRNITVGHLARSMVEHCMAELGYKEKESTDDAT